MNKCTLELFEAMDRAGVYYRYDILSDTMHFVSRNNKHPLTDDEKQHIIRYFGLRMNKFKVVFDN